ncbi:hypothetical protein ACIL5T_003736 [Escherichia coli]|nr:hypothetical protein [Escherichia coli]EFK6340797.1 hypothetical protein [Escherichia coli]EGE7609436.1 hypothetical protein [Escherichia coli]EIT3616852.1 hypothetical protein [Escherichia coli]EIV8281374.1 hypothetical protein [Escherichia coli]
MNNSKLKKILIASIIGNILLVFLNIQVFNKKSAQNITETDKVGKTEIKKTKSTWDDINTVNPICNVNYTTDSPTFYDKEKSRSEPFCFWFNPATDKYTFFKNTLISSRGDGMFFFSKEHTPIITLYPPETGISVPIDIYFKQRLDRLSHGLNAKIIQPKEAKLIKSKNEEKLISSVVVVPTDKSRREYPREGFPLLVVIIKKNGTLWKVSVDYIDDYLLNDKKHWYNDKEIFDLIDNITSTF